MHEKIVAWDLCLLRSGGQWCVLKLYRGVVENGGGFVIYVVLLTEDW